MRTTSGQHREVYSRTGRTAKTLLALHGCTTSETLKRLINDIAIMKCGECHKLSRKNAGISLFQGGCEVSLEFYAEKTNAACFAIASHQRKRAHCLTIGRFYNNRLFDAVEIMINDFKQITEFGQVASSAIAGSKPCLQFSGEKFETDEKFKMLKNIFLDIFRGRTVSHINLKGIDRCILLNATDDGFILFRQFAIKYKKSGTKLPKIYFEEMGPRFDAKVGRSRAPSMNLQKEAFRTSLLDESSVKHSNDKIVDKIGRIHVNNQVDL